MSKTKVLQTTTTIAKTTQTLIGEIIETGYYDYLTLYFTYTKGDETGLTIVPSFLHEYTGTAHPFLEWTATAGAKTATPSTLTETVTRDGYITLDIRGHEYVQFTQGGTANDGTPTGTLSASYLLKG